MRDGMKVRHQMGLPKLGAADVGRRSDHQRRWPCRYGTGGNGLHETGCASWRCTNSPAPAGRFTAMSAMAIRDLGRARTMPQARACSPALITHISAANILQPLGASRQARARSARSLMPPPRPCRKSYPQRSAAGKGRIVAWPHFLQAVIWLAVIRDHVAMNTVWDRWMPQGLPLAGACGEARLAGDDQRVEIIVTATADQPVPGSGKSTLK